MSSYLSISDVENRGEIFLGEPQPRKFSAKKTIFTTLAAFITYLTVFACITPFKSSLPVLQLVNPFIFIENIVSPDAVVATNTTEVFEVLAPLSIPLGSYIVSETFFNNSIVTKDSISFEYEAPELFNYTGVLLDLNFTVEGTQEPVVFEVYIDDYPIWRTSTPNPLGTAANSSTTKNITEFVSLFESNNVLTLQLIDGSITGDVNVSLGASFYNDSLIATGTPVAVAPIDITSIFYPEGPADFIFPLSQKGKPYSLPKDTVSVVIPQVAENVTSAKVKLFASASEEETNFYLSAINGPTGGANKGPLRTLNVYLNSIFVGAVSPNPILLKPNAVAADASYAWSPLAAFGSFDALAYEVDLTAVLPLLWEDDSTLTVEVVSPVKTSTIVGPPSIPGPVSPPGVDKLDASKWLISGNFFAWSSELVNLSIGEVVLADSLVSGTGILIEPPFGGVSNQIVRSSTTSGIQSQLNFTLIDGSLHNLTYNFNASSKTVSVKNTKLAGASTKLTYISANKFGISIEDETLLPIFTRNVSSAYPLTISETKAAPVAFGPPTNNSLNITSSVSLKVKNNKKTVLSIYNKMNSTIDDLTYSTDVDVFEQLPSSPIPFARKVTAENGLITKDSLLFKTKLFDLQDFNTLDEQFAALNEVVDAAASMIFV